jgi:hypothetical protein
MLIYKVYYKNYKLKKGELLGVLIERRKDLRGHNQIESGLKWARLVFGNKVDNVKELLVVPKELRIGLKTPWLIERGFITKEELLEINKLTR